MMFNLKVQCDLGFFNKWDYIINKGKIGCFNWEYQIGELKRNK